MQMESMKLSPPWVQAHEQFKALFGEDPDITVGYTDKSGPGVTLKVDSQTKADALSRILPERIMMGGVEFGVTVVPGNKAGPALPEDAGPAELAAAAFAGNPHVAQIRQVSKGLFRDLCYVVFRKEVVQYPADNLADVNGNMSTLMEDVARDLLTEAHGMYFCTTAVGGPLGAQLDKPLGEWP